MLEITWRHLYPAASGGVSFAVGIGLFVYRRRVVTPRLAQLWGLSPRLAEALARKESLECTSCGAKLRGRRIAQVLMALYPSVGPPARSLAEWVLRDEIRKLRVAEINVIDGLHSFVRTLPFYSGSDFADPSGPAADEPGARSEDLTRLSYADNAFDLVVTSESLEHVPDLHAALSEILRVLAPGGRHVFTVPVLPKTKVTFSRSVVLPDGTIDDRAPRICHPGGDWGYPVFTEFGTDLPELLSQQASRPRSTLAQSARMILRRFTSASRLNAEDAIEPGCVFVR